jgi:hypothetical protein
VTRSLRLPKSVDIALKKMATAEGRTANRQVEMLIRKATEPAASRPSLTALASRLFGSGHGVNLALPPRDSTQDRAPPDFATEAG